MESIGSPALLAGFTGFVLFLLALDLGVFHRHAHEVRFKEALGWSVFWIGLAGVFAGWIAWAFGPDRALEFTTGYVIEKALSVDNVFVFLAIFSTFGVAPAYQHRVLFWGILGALVFRALFIVVGAAALEAFHGVLYVMGGILFVTGLKMLKAGDHAPEPEKNPAFRFLARVLPTTTRDHGARFWVREGGRWVATPLFLVLVLVELTDVVFAVDSIPAIFAVTRDPFIVYTSNILAILGLRALYFCVAGFVARLRYLKVGLAFVLMFVAGKMLASGVWKIPVEASLAVIATILATSVVASLVATRGSGAPQGELPGGHPAAPAGALDRRPLVHEQPALARQPAAEPGE